MGNNHSKHTCPVSDTSGPGKLLIHHNNIHHNKVNAYFTYSYPTYSWQLNMAYCIDDSCRDHRTLLGSDRPISHLQTGMSLFESSGTKTVCAPPSEVHLICSPTAFLQDHSHHQYRPILRHHLVPLRVARWLSCAIHSPWTGRSRGLPHGCFLLAYVDIRHT